MDRGHRRVILLCVTGFLLAILIPMIAVGSVSADAEPTSQMDNTDDQNESVATDELTTGTELLSASSDDSSTEAQSTATAPSIELTQDLSLLPDEPGTYEVTHEYSLPDNAALLEFTLPEGAAANDVDGFVQRDDRSYEWDGRTAAPSVTYRLNANRSVDGTGPIDAAGRYVFVDVGDWALVSQPRVSHRWGWRGERIGLESEMTTDQGVTSDVIAYLGEYEKETHEAHDQEFKLVIPEAASLEEEPDELFESLGDASDTLRVGERDEQVFMVAAPTGNVDWGVRGLQTGPADLWVRDFERLDEAANVWVHEYVHTRQGYTSASDFRWFTEATATYYAALLTLEQDRIGFDEFADELAIGERPRFSQSVLTDPTSWATAADYRLGALVTGVIDKDIRNETGGEQSFDEVFRQMNAKDGVVSASDFEDSIAQVASSDTAAAAATYTGTTEHPMMWDEATHAEIFDQVPPARITFTLGEGELEPTVSGPYRDRGVGPVRPIPMVPGETLEISVIAQNFGGVAGDYRTSFRVNDRDVSEKEGTLDPRATETLDFSYTIEDIGEKQLSVGDVTVPVSVVDPAEADVTAFSANTTTAAPGETVTLTATVENSASYPGERTLSLAQNNEQIDEETVRLDGESSTTIEFTATVSETGSTVFTLGDVPIEPVIVDVQQADEDGAGFNVTAGIAALVIIAALLFSRGRMRAQDR